MDTKITKYGDLGTRVSYKSVEIDKKLALVCLESSNTKRSILMNSHKFVTCIKKLLYGMQMQGPCVWGKVDIHMGRDKKWIVNFACLSTM